MRLSRIDKPIGHSADVAIGDDLKARQFRSSAINSLAQAYNTPLTVIMTASAGLREVGQLSEFQADLVALIDEHASLLADITAQLLAAARMDDENSITLKYVGVEPIIDEASSRLKARFSSQAVLTDLEDDNMLLFCDRSLILLLVTQYLDHAHTYCFDGTPITLRAARVGSRLIFSVHSFRPPIPAMDLASIFEPDFPFSQHGYHAAGYGIGLWLAKRVAAIHHGAVWVESTADEGTTFFAGIPSDSSEAASNG
jgi:K+-sensing histidine kinase KdpD